MTITLLLNSEGKKMGKTQSGAVWLDPNKTSPFEFYQYWRNIADADVLKCLRMLTFLPLEQIDEMDKWEGSQLNEAKEILAYELTAWYTAMRRPKRPRRAQGPCLQAVMQQKCPQPSSLMTTLPTAPSISCPSYRNPVSADPAPRPEEMWSRAAYLWTAKL